MALTPDRWSGADDAPRHDETTSNDRAIKPFFHTDLGLLTPWGRSKKMTTESATNIRFRLLVNGELRGTAGVKSFGVLSQTLSWVRRDPDRARRETIDVQEWVCDKIHLHFGGLDSTTNEHLDWFDCEVRVGDEITMQILAPGEFDPPAERHQATCTLGPRSRRRRGIRLKRQLKGPPWRRGRR